LGAELNKLTGLRLKPTLGEEGLAIGFEKRAAADSQKIKCALPVPSNPDKI
jgi:hypothetical protein